MTTHQELYWELKAKLFATQAQKEKMEANFAEAFREIKETINPVDYKTIFEAQVCYEGFSVPYESAKQSYDSKIENITRQLEELNLEHGPLREFHPAIIDAMFTSDIPPLWSDHETVQ